jgi:energy-coupling factor transport system substrate-specific component
MVYFLTCVLGFGVFLFPFFLPLSENIDTSLYQNVSSPLFLTVLGGLCLIALLLEMRDVTQDTKFVALLGVLVAINAGLSFLETAIPGPGGFSPIFFLIIISGYVFGGRFGFLMGVLTIFVGALISGGIGPWLPSKMLTAGWVGLSAPVARLLYRREGLPMNADRAERINLMVLGIIWGILYGAIMNLWFWPFASGPETQHWQAGEGILSTIQRYSVFYMTTSLIWDVARAAGTASLIMLLGTPTLHSLRRFQRRFDFHYSQAEPLSVGESSRL